MKSKHWKALNVALASTYPTGNMTVGMLLQWEKDCAAIAEVCRLYQTADCRFDDGRWSDGLEREVQHTKD